MGAPRGEKHLEGQLDEGAGREEAPRNLKTSRTGRTDGEAKDRAPCPLWFGASFPCSVGLWGGLMPTRVSLKLCSGGSWAPGLS